MAKQMISRFPSVFAATITLLHQAEAGPVGGSYNWINWDNLGSLPTPPSPPPPPTPSPTAAPTPSPAPTDEFIAVDYCPSETDDMLPFTHTEVKTGVVSWEACVQTCWEIGPAPCQFVFYATDTATCYRYLKDKSKHLSRNTMDCRTDLHGDKQAGAFYVREFQFLIETGDEVPVGRLGSLLRQKIAESIIFENEKHNPFTLLEETETFHCDANLVSQVSRRCGRVGNGCSETQTALANSKCGKFKREGQIRWHTSSHELGNVTVKEFWEGMYKEIVLETIKRSVAGRAPATVYEGCKGCGSRPGRQKIAHISTKYTAERMPETLSVELVRYYSGRSQHVDVVAHFDYKFLGMVDAQFVKRPFENSCQRSQTAGDIDVALGALGLIPGPVGAFLGIFSIGFSQLCV